MAQRDELERMPPEDPRRRAGWNPWAAAILIFAIVAFGAGLVIAFVIQQPADVGAIGEPTTTLGRIVERPVEYYGEMVRVEGRIRAVVVPGQAYVFETPNENAFMLVLLERGPTEPVGEGDLARVEGEVVVFDKRRIGDRFGLDGTNLQVYGVSDGQPAVVARGIMPVEDLSAVDTSSNRQASGRHASR